MTSLLKKILLLCIILVPTVVMSSSPVERPLIITRIKTSTTTSYIRIRRWDRSATCATCNPTTNAYTTFKETIVDNKPTIEVLSFPEDIIMFCFLEKQWEAQQEALKENRRATKLINQIKKELLQ